MSIIETIILGLIQGLTEFIPISSSGHLVIGQVLFGGASDHLFLEFINIGTMLALFVFFRKKIMTIIRDIFVDHNVRLARNILITAIPAGAVGFLLSDFIGSAAFFGSLIVVMVTLATVGLVMVLLERLPRASEVEGGDKLSVLRAFVIGAVQVFALIPGVSRSGSTIIAGRLAGLHPAAAAEYSFLASLPIMVGVTVKTLVGDQDYLIAHMLPLLIGNVVAFIAGLLAVGFLMSYLSRHSLAIFGWYRIGLAAILAVYLLIQWL
ncbi:MAG TPA: undecaprenyl-diphosphate phosphatase [Candidatus Saccharimonadales bacterium]|nr:undecaprenyl-diphosphate phosphatase [Candidatus Saccharimonadales bacterium]